MAGKVLDLTEVIVPDQLGTTISERYIDWRTRANQKVEEWNEVRKYIFATDTTQTTNSSLPWSNKTVIPKIAQIRDNLFANYMAAMFPKRNWLSWEGNTELDETGEDGDKKESIESYMSWVAERTDFREILGKLVLDYIDYGNAFAMPEWVDERAEQEDKTQTGYVGPRPVRISPLDLVFNPTAPTFKEAPKIIRSFVSLGEVKEILERFSVDSEDQQKADELWNYLKHIRQHMANFDGPIHVKDEFFAMDGFTDFRQYLASDTAEILTFYGDLYDREQDEFLRNHVIMVVDRHKIIYKEPNSSFFGFPPIFHVGWRQRQDNLWAMGPLDNLVGMQYRINHLENNKADLYDITKIPIFKIKGYVEDFDWAPGEKIYVGDDGDVELLSPDVRALEANFEIQQLEDKMEAMAGAPKEALGFRSPGEKTAFEVQRLENAASRIFQSKISQFEQQMTEPLLNSMLELARRKMTEQVIRTFDNDFKIANFERLTVDDITGSGRLRPKAAQHFAEKANQIQNLTNFFNSSIGADQEVKLHFSSVQLAKLSESLLDLEEERIVQPFIRLTEQQEAQREQASLDEQFLTELNTPSGLFEDDFDEDVVLEQEIASDQTEDTSDLG